MRRRITTRTIKWKMLGAMKLHHLCKRAETHFEDVEHKKLERLAAIKEETANVENFFNTKISKTSN